MAFNNGFPVSYQPAYVPVNTMPVQQSYQPYQQLQQNNVPINYNQNSYGQQQNIPQLPQNSVGTHGASTTDIIWVTDEQEVIDYPIAVGSNGMFMDINRMKLYTKDGSTGLIRDFDLNESSESIQRYQQMKQRQNAQFPVVDTTAKVIESNSYDSMKEVDQRIDEKIDQRLMNLEQKIAELSQNINSENDSTNKTRTVGKPIPKK